MSVDDKALRGLADEIKGVAGDEGEFGFVANVEHPHLIRRNDLGGIDNVAVGAGVVGDVDLHIFGDVLERPEESIAVAGEAERPQASGHGGALDVTDASLQAGGVEVREDRDGEADGGNVEAAHDIRGLASLVRYVRCGSDFLGQVLSLLAGGVHLHTPNAAICSAGEKDNPEQPLDGNGCVSGRILIGA